MWDWFITNRALILLISGSLLIILFLVGDRLRDLLVNRLAETRREKARRNLTLTLRIIELVMVFLILPGLVAMASSKEGMLPAVTSDMVQDWLLEHGTRVFTIIVIGILMWYATKKSLPALVRRVVTQTREKESRDEMRRRENTLLFVFLSVGKITIVIVTIFMVLSELNIPIGPILAGFGIAGIAVGFGAQYLIRDLIAGIFIIMENQYRVGDVAKVADISGLVEEVNLRKTVLRDLDGVVHHVPNGEIKVASNFSRYFARVNLDISVAYKTDIDRAISVINDVCKELARDDKWAKSIITQPRVLWVSSLGESGVQIKVVGDVKPLQQWDVMGEMRLRLKKAFDAEGIEIALPHIKVYFGNPPGSAPASD
jgi:small conductance mechanosensitive channel